MNYLTTHVHKVKQRIFKDLQGSSMVHQVTRMNQDQDRTEQVQAILLHVSIYEQEEGEI